MPELATSGNAFDKRRFSRRGFLGAGIASGFALAACASKPTASGAAGMTAAIDAAEAARPHSGRTVTATLTPQPARIDLGGPIVSTLTYGNTIPGPLIRATVGDEIVVSVTNRLGDPTSCIGTASRCATIWMAPSPRLRTSAPAVTLRTGSPCRIRAPTGPIRTSVFKATTAYICLSSSTIRLSQATTTPNGSSSSTIGRTASGSPRNSSTAS